MYQSSASEKINGRIELVMSTQAPAASNWSALMRSHVSLAVEVLAGIGNRSCRRCHSAPSECRCELMALVLLHHTVKCCSNLSEAKMAAQALISHSVQLSSLEDSVDVCALKAKCMTQVCCEPGPIMQLAGSLLQVHFAFHTLWYLVSPGCFPWIRYH